MNDLPLPSWNEIKECVPKPFGVTIGKPIEGPSTKRKWLSLDMLFSAFIIDSGPTMETLAIHPQ
jgi:hypothetical protein